MANVVSHTTCSETTRKATDSEKYPSLAPSGTTRSMQSASTPEATASSSRKQRSLRDFGVVPGTYFSTVMMVALELPAAFCMDQLTSLPLRTPTRSRRSNASKLREGIIGGIMGIEYLVIRSP